MDSLVFFGQLANAAGIIGGAYAFLAWYQARTLRREILEERELLHKKVRVKLRLTDGEGEISLPVELRRAELTRAELLGRLGMIPMRKKGRRFSLNYLGKPAFLQDINRVLESRGNELIIPCTKEEMEQFDL